MPDFSQTQKIRAEGEIALQIPGAVDATGKAVAQLRGELGRFYQPQFPRSEVVVTLK